MPRKTFLITLIIILLFSSIAYGNAGPTYWEGNPALEVLSVEENSPIVVEKEYLTFDFTRPELDKYTDYNKAGLVTASYEMSNPTDKEVSVQMAFPLISRITDLESKATKIMVDNEDIAYEIFIGDTVDGVLNRVDEDKYNELDFDSILNSISNTAYIPQNFKLDDIGKLYRFDIENTSDKGIHFVIDFNHDKEKTKIFSDGFTSYHGNEEGATEIGSYIHWEESLELFVLGQDIDFNINVYSDVDKKETSENYLLQEESRSISVQDYLIDYFENYIENNDYYSDLPYQQLLNLYLKNADEMFIQANAYIWLSELTSFKHYDWFFVLLYQVKFSPSEIRDISVSYITKGTMDKKDTVEPLHTYEYLLNPASSWADFKDLNIEIIPPQDSPFIIESSLELVRNEEGSYIGRFESLPEEDLTFTLYEKEEVTFIDKIAASLDRAFYILPIFIVPIIAIITIIIIVFLIKRYKKNKN